MNSKTPIPVSEAFLQDALYRYLRGKGCWPIFPNIDCITGYEADMMVITKAGYAHEYEIKLCISDFRADLKKRLKHAVLSGNVKEIPHPYDYGEPKTIHVHGDANPNDKRIMWERCYPEHRPKHFWYVIHGFDVPEKEIPAYAGLMKYGQIHGERYGFDVIKQAPTLPSQPVKERKVQHATVNMLFRYWNMRLERTGKAGDRL